MVWGGKGGYGAYGRMQSKHRQLFQRLPAALCFSVVGALQHALAQGQIPVVFCAVFFEVFPGHVLRRALLELHVSKTALFSRSLQEQRN